MKFHIFRIFNTEKYLEQILECGRLGSQLKGQITKIQAASLKHDTCSRLNVSVKYRNQILMEEGTACKMNIKNGVTNPQILRLCCILTRLLCQQVPRLPT